MVRRMSGQNALTAIVSNADLLFLDEFYSQENKSFKSEAIFMDFYFKGHKIKKLSTYWILT